jgi:tRNA-dihydrouridine synthase A
LSISINGGVKTLEETLEHLALVDGVMMGREVYSNPCILNEVENRVYLNATELNRSQIVEEMLKYTELQIEQGARTWHVARHMLGLFQGQAGGRIWRRYLSQNGTQKGTKANLLTDALEQVLEAQSKAEEYQSSRPPQ